MTRYRFVASRWYWCETLKYQVAAEVCRHKMENGGCPGCMRGVQDKGKYGSRMRYVLDSPFDPRPQVGGVVSVQDGRVRKLDQDAMPERRAPEPETKPKKTRSTTDVSTSGTLEREFRRLTGDDHAKGKRRRS